MKYAAIAAALVASTQAACAAKPIASISGFSDAKCTKALDATADKTAIAGLATAVTALDTWWSKAIDKCLDATAAELGDATILSMKVTCTATVVTIAYYSDKACKTAADATLTAKGAYAAVMDSAKCLTAHPKKGGALPAKTLGLKVVLAKADKTDAAGASGLGAAIAAATLAVAASFY